MVRSALLLVCVASCVGELADPGEDAPALDASIEVARAALTLEREHVTADIYHYVATLPVGTTPNAVLRVHRVVREVAPFVPRATARAAMLLHGDFATFVTSFAPTLGTPASSAPGLAPYLAAAGIDVWGLDRRFTVAGADADVADFAAMGVAQELDDLRAALTLARATRLAGGSGGGRLALVGFSHGGQLAYTYAASEGGRPAAQRQVGALVAMDFYGALSPAQEDLRATFCESAGFEAADLAAGIVDAPNDFVITAGALARSAPDETSPLLPARTNLGAMLFTVGETYKFAPLAPKYHLLSPALGGANGTIAIALRETSVDAATAWLAGAPPHASLREGAELDALLCGDGPPPVDAPLSQIRVPLLYLGAAGGAGAEGLFATTQVASTDVTSHIVQRFPAERRAEDFGHADLLFATDAPAAAWQPLAAWLARH